MLNVLYAMAVLAILILIIAIIDIEISLVETCKMVLITLIIQ